MADAENNLPRRGYGYRQPRVRSARMPVTAREVPATVWDDVRAVVSSLPPGDSEYIRNLPEADLISLHRTLGLNLRNAFRAGSLRA